jgi:16S rRNA G966 N2-methylase RsmD
LRATARSFEALRRAASVVMVEKSPRRCAAARRAAKLGATGPTVVRGDALGVARGARSRFDVVFVDPPYRLGMQVAALELLGLLAEGGGVETDAVFEPPRGWVVFGARARETCIFILVREADDQGGVSNV